MKTLITSTLLALTLIAGVAGSANAASYDFNASWQDKAFTSGN